MCPGSNETHKHSYSLKSLVDVHFTEEKAEDGTVSRVCPSCKKNLSNGLKAMRTCEMLTGAFGARCLLGTLGLGVPQLTVYYSDETLWACYLLAVCYEVYDST